jgi:glycosyltransferase involved in cell wall biosynthesis
LKSSAISVAIITKNEAEDIGACLESVVGWAKEIVVVDSGSSDGTTDICRRYGARVIETADWPGFGRQKNRAVDACDGDWILCLDADEKLPGALRDEIVSAIREGRHDAFRLPRLSSFCGNYIHHSGWRPDYVIRLFRKGHGRFSDDLVHEKVIVAGSTGTLRESILHASIGSVEELLDKINSYSTASAQMMREDGRETSMLQAVVRAMWAFFRSYVLRMGILDGRDGFMLAVSSAELTYYKYVKLMLARPGGKA